MLGVASAHATHRGVVAAGGRRFCAFTGRHRQAELKTDDEGEELIAIYVARGLDPKLAVQVAQQLMAHDALEVRMRAMDLASTGLSWASASGCVGVRRQLRRRSAHASRGRNRGAPNGFDPACLWKFTAFPGDSRRVGCARWGAAGMTVQVGKWSRWRAGALLNLDQSHPEAFSSTKAAIRTIPPEAC